MGRYVGMGRGFNVPERLGPRPRGEVSVKSIIKPFYRSYNFAKSIAARGLYLEAGRRAYGLVKRIYKRKPKPDLSKYNRISFEQVENKENIPPVDSGMKRRGRYIPVVAYKRQNVGAVNRDPSRFQPLTYTKRRYGRRRGRVARINRIVKSITVPTRFRFQNQTGITTPNGAEWMTDANFQIAPGGTYYRTLPVKLFLLNGIVQGTPGGTEPFPTNSSFPAFSLAKGLATASDYRFINIEGQQPNSAGPSFALQYENVDGTTFPILGRKSYWDWSRAKLTLYGKLYEQTTFTIRIVKFIDDEYNPLYSGLTYTNITSPANVRFSTSLTTRAAQWYGLMCHKLMNNPSSSAYNPVINRRVMKVLKTMKVTLDPVLTTERAGGDASTVVPHMRCLDIFNRWGRIVNYQNPTGTDVPSFGELQAPNWYPERSTQTGFNPSMERDMVFLMISCDAYRTADAEVDPLNPTNGTTASIDFNLTTQHSAVVASS